MNTRDYIEQAIRTKSDKFYAPAHGWAHVNAISGKTAQGMEIDVLHAAVGISTEAAEILNAAKKSMFYGFAVDYTNMDEEMGDVLWYIAIYCNARGIAMEQLMTQNIAKLRQRFPACFSEEAANTRDLAAERAVLDAHSQTAPPPVILPTSERTTPPHDDTAVAAVSDD